MPIIMNYIRSRDNGLIKWVRSLSRKKYRSQYRSFLSEGYKLVNEAIENDIEVSYLFMSESFFVENSEKTLFVDEEKTYIVEDSTFRSMGTMKNPEGIIAVLKMKEEEEIEADRILLLDSIRDPGNMGTIIRSCEAFGFTKVLTYGDCVDIYNPKTLRGSMGSIFRVDVTDVDLDGVKELQREGYYLYATDINDSVEVGSVQRKYKTILAIGSESHGVSEEILELANSVINIPMGGRLNSLNAAIAASIAMYEFSK